MRRVKKESFFILLVFVFLTIFLFRPYFFKNQVPFPANLLVSFYSPWRFYSWEGYPNGPPNKPIGFDNLKLFYPYRKFTTEELKRGNWPLWNPYNFSGNVHLATYQTAVFYPLNIVYFLFPLIDAWSFLVIIQPILAGFFTYLFLRQLKLSSKASFFGALVFAFSGWMLAWSQESLVIEHSALWLPLILYAIERVYHKISFFNIFLLIFALTSSILAGFLQMTLYVFLAIFAWVIFRHCKFLTIVKKRQYLKRYFWLVFSLLAALSISAVHLIPAVEAYFYSPRAVVDAKFLFKTYLMKPWHLITLLAPDFWGNPGFYNYFGEGFYHEKVIFVGIPALLFALYASLSLKKNGSLRFFKYLTLITLVLGFFPLGWLLYFSRLPLFSTMIPSRIFFLSTFGVSLMAAFGMDDFLKKRAEMKLWQNIFAVVSLAFFILWLFVFLERLTDPLGDYAKVSLRNLVLPSGIFLACIFFLSLKLLSGRLKLTSYFGLISLSLLSSFYFARKFLYFSERRFVFPEVPVITKLREAAGINRVWGYGGAYWPKNMNIYYRLYSPEGYDALYLQRYGELLHAQETEGKISSQILRTDADIKQASERESILDNWQRKRLLVLLGVKYILETKVSKGKKLNITEKRFPKEHFSLVWEDEKFRIWEYKEALPRAFLAFNYQIAKEKQEIADLIFSPKIDLSKTVILEEKPKFNDKAREQCSNEEVKRNKAEIVKYTPNEVILQVVTNCPAILFLSDNYYPGWKAYVNEKESKIYRANYSFRAVAVSKGAHQIKFIYQPASFLWGLRISVVSLLLLMPVYYLLRRYV